MCACAIELKDVGKRYRMRGLGSRSIKSVILDVVHSDRTTNDEFWALKDIRFEVEEGETLGIIGSNGAGKSTLLSILAGTKRPTQGHVRTVGTVSSLLELGAGFHPDLSGRENVFLAGAVMGLSRKTMRKRFDAIVDFAGIDTFIDQPVRHYSSGMYVRLGFAVAVEVDPDILLIDEVLAVGDIAFQKKCIDKMKEFKTRGKTMLIISHDLATIQSISDRILLLEEGRLDGIGDPGDVVNQYKSKAGRKGAESLGREWGTGEVTITGVDIRDAQGSAIERIRSGDALDIKIHFDSRERVENPVFGFSLSSDSGVPVYGNNTQIESHAIPAIEGAGTVSLRFDALPLATGTYMLSVSAHSADHTLNYHRLDHAFPIFVESEKDFEGCYMPVQWSGP
jgi:ABC-type polysaccharide/polyol phosphate transport system ATPase subunit